MPTLNQTLQAIAEKFAADLLMAVRGSSLAEILGESASPKNGSARRKPGRPSKSTQAGAKRGPGRPPNSARSRISVDSVVAALKAHKDGLGAASLRMAVGAKRSTWKYVIAKAIAEKRVRIQGARSKAVYFAT
jgi:hypothetical protein